MSQDHPPKIESIIWPDDHKEMVFIAGGTFMMGSDSDSEAVAPAHPVKVADFYLDRWPVTNADYKAFIDATNHPVPNYHVLWCNTAGYNWDPETRMYPAGKADHPVVLVTWADALAYATWANKRLPTEAEWEFAARGLEGRRWPWGNKFGPNRCNTTEAGQNGTSVVGKFSPQGDTPESVIDLVGNVWEWTNSIYQPYPYDAQDGRETLHSNKWRVLRGASWLNDATIANAISRLDGDFLFYTNVGFRCAATAGD